MTLAASDTNPTTGIDNVFASFLTADRCVGNHSGARIAQVVGVVSVLRQLDHNRVALCPDTFVTSLPEDREQ